MDAVLEKHIESTPGICGGKPRLLGTRITVADVVTWHLRLGLSIEEIAGTYNLPLASIHAAMVYYYDHRTEVDQSIEEGRAFAETLRAGQPSLLQAKLKAARRG